MQGSSFNDGWRVQFNPDKVGALFGAEAAWTQVRLPHDAMIALARDPQGSPAAGYFPGGVWRYEKTFPVPIEERGKRIMLEFEGVYRSAAVYLNDVLVGHRPYGYSNFYVRLDQLIRYGESNRITVDAISHDDARWYSGAGIYRDTTLITGPTVHIAADGIRIVTPDTDADMAIIDIATDIESDSGLTVSTTLVTELIDDTGMVVARGESPLAAPPAGTRTVRQRLLIADPRRWVPASPTLYTCRSRLSSDDGTTDEAATTFGIRSLQVDAARGLRINGETVKLRGACVHHDNGVIGAATIDRADERRVELLKRAGFNALRSAHNPMSKAMLNACDRLGMLVLDEAFDVWTHSKTPDDYSRAFPDWWRQDLTAMVVKDINHPSVIMYSIGNEIPDAGNPTGAAQARAMAELIRTLDPHRPVTNAINPVLSCLPDIITDMIAAEKGQIGPEGSDVNVVMSRLAKQLPALMQQEVVGDKLAESFSVLDVAGYNYTESRYEMDHNLFPQRVIVGTESNPPQIGKLWRLVTDHDHVIGDFTWTGWDYLGEVGIGRLDFDATEDDRKLLGRYPWLTSATGDLDITGFRRPISYLREIVFGLRLDPYPAVLPPRYYGKTPVVMGPWASAGLASWTWPEFEGQPIQVVVYADADEVALLVNGAEVGRSPAGERYRYRAEFDAIYEPGELTAVAFRGTVEIGRYVLNTASRPMQLDVEVDRDRIRADDTDLSFVTITVVDRDGIIHHGADTNVTIEVDGPGELLGFGNGNPCTDERFDGQTHSTFEGRALAVIRPTGAGEIGVTVMADKCAGRTVRIYAGSKA